MNKLFSCTIILLLLGCQAGRPATVAYATEPVREPVPFAPGVITTEDHSEFDIMFTPDGRTAYFSRRAPGEKQRLYETKFLNGNWSSPTLCAFSTDRDETASITPDG